MSEHNLDIPALVAANYALTVMLFGKLRASAIISHQDATQILAEADHFLEEFFGLEVALRAQRVLALLLQSSRDVS